MATEDALALQAAMEQEASVTDADIVRANAAYYNLMNPEQPALSCSCCGISDVPVTEGTPTRSDIQTFRCVRMDDVLLNPLRYDAAENLQYCKPLPAHMMSSGFANPLDTPLNRELWRVNYRCAISCVEIGSDGKLAAPRDNTVPLPDIPVPLPDGTHRLHLSPGLVEPDDAPVYLCSSCDKSLLKGNVPLRSIKAGWDYGCPELTGGKLPPLGLAECCAIAKVRVINTCMLVRVPRYAG